MFTRTITVELPEKPSSGAYAGCPSGDTEYSEDINEWVNKCNQIILEKTVGNPIVKVTYYTERKNIKRRNRTSSNTCREYAEVEVED